MRRKRLLALALLAAVVLNVDSARAGMLVVYDLEGRSAGETLFQPPTFVAPGLSSRTLTAGSGLTANGLVGAYAFTGWTTGTDLDAADYIGFTVTPDVGNSIIFDTISLRLTSVFNDPKGPQSWRLQGSTNGFARSTLLAEFNSTGGGFTVGPLSLAELGTIDTAVEFRLYGFAAGSSDSLGGLAFDSEFPEVPGVVLTGTVQSVVVIPEPSTIVLLGTAAALHLVGHRRRRA